MFPETIELLLTGYSIASIWTPKSKSNTLTPKNQLADILTKGNFTRDEWNHLLCLFSISDFSSTNFSEVMSKRTQKDSGEERVTAKSKPMMNLVSRCSERTPDVLPSTASQSPEKTRHESQLPLSAQTEQHHRTVGYSEWNVDKTWSSQEWKSDELMDDRTERPVVNAQHTDRFIVENDNTNSYTEAESELSLESKSFLHRVNDQVRKRQNRSSKDATKDSDKHSVIWRMFMFSTLLASSKKKYRSSHNETDVDTSEKLISEQSGEIFGISKINWEDSSWKYLSLVGDEESHQSLAHKGLRISRFCIMPWKGEREAKVKHCMGRQIDVVQKFTVIQKLGHNWWWAKGIRVEYFPRIHHIAALQQSPRVTVKIERRTRKNTGRIIFMSMFNDISWWSKDNEKSESSA